jgi:hypothetical protein
VPVVRSASIVMSRIVFGREGFAGGEESRSL